MEYRIGNYFDYEATTHQITSIDLKDDLGEPYLKSVWIEDRFDDIYEHTLDYMKPIKVTEDWLKRLGFKNESGNEWNNHSSLTPGIVLQDFNGELAFSAGEGVRLSRQVRYVHELQNLYFGLTGEELTIRE